MYSKQRGNILFLILLAVVLFAALSYAVTSSIQGGGKDLSGERAGLAASNIMQAGILMANGVNRMMLTNGCKLSELSFEDSYDTGYVNNTRADGSCKLFGTLGGGLEYPVPDSAWFDRSFQATYPAYGKWFFHNNVCVAGVGTGPDKECWRDGVNTDSDLVVYLPFVSQSVCKAINEGLGIPHMASGDAQHMNGAAIDVAASAHKFIGAFLPDTTFHIWGSGSLYGGTPTAFAARYQGCFRTSGPTDTFTATGRYDGFYVFYQVLLAR